MATFQAKWVSLAAAPFGHNAFISDPQRGSLYAVGEKIGLIKYSQHANKWQKVSTINELSKNYISPFSYKPRYATAINSTTNTLFVYHPTGSIAIMKLAEHDNHKFKWQIINNLTLIGFESQGIIIDNQFHVIGCDEHSKFNQITKLYMCI